MNKIQPLIKSTEKLRIELNKLDEATASELWIFNGFVSLLEDTVYCSHILADLRDRFKSDSLASLRHKMQQDKIRVLHPNSPVPPDYVSTGSPYLPHMYGAAIKSWFFPVRAFQDYAYKILMLSHGMKPGQSSSMKAILEDVKSPNLAVKAIRDDIPAYQGWFKDFRDKRNALKEGAHTIAAWHSTTGGSFGHSIYIRPNDGPQSEVREAYLDESMDLTKQLFELVLGKARESKVIFPKMGVAA